MRKIPTVFQRDPNDRRHLLPEVVEGCEWVLAGEGIATRKYDGTCVMYDGKRWWARREVRSGRLIPSNFQEVEYDENTGKTVGWEPIEASGYAKWHAEALKRHLGNRSPGTYELCGPKVQGNPERFDGHILIAHSLADVVRAPRDFAGLREYLLTGSYEGIVWHHSDGRMAKLKRRDFA